MTIINGVTGRPVASIDPNAAACGNCIFHRPDPDDLAGAGHCGWLPPPALARLYNMLAAEPATKIDYEGTFDEMPDAMFKGACDAWKRKTDA